MAINTETTNDALELVHIRNAFYRKKYHAMLGIALLGIIVIISLITLFMFLLNNGSRPLYFVANDDGVLIQETQLSLPLPMKQVNAWVIEAIESANSFDFVNYRSQLQDSQKYFSDYAWSEYMKGLTASLNLEPVKRNNEVWISKVVGVPTVLNAGAIKGEYAWRFELIVKETGLMPPLYVPSAARINTYKVNVVVQRKPLLQSYQGLAVLSMIKERIVTSPRPNTMTR